MHVCVVPASGVEFVLHSTSLGLFNLPLHLCGTDECSSLASARLAWSLVKIVLHSRYHALILFPPFSPIYQLTLAVRSVFPIRCIDLHHA